jgi:hypothetical protein
MDVSLGLNSASWSLDKLAVGPEQLIVDVNPDWPV